MADLSMANNSSSGSGGRILHDWTFEEVEHLISLWGQHVELYDIRHADYTKRDKRRAAMEYLSDQLQISVPEIKKKMTNLRTYYTKELWKERPGGKDNDPSKPPYHSKWQHLKSLHYLRDNCVATNNDRPSQHRSPEYDDDDSDSTWDEVRLSDQTIEINTDSTATTDSEQTQAVHTLTSTVATPLNSPTTNVFCKPDKRPKRTAENLETVIAKLHKSPSKQDSNNSMPVLQPTNPDLVFANHVGLTLMNIKDQRTKELAKLKIQQALFEAQYSSPPAQIVLQEHAGVQIAQPLNGDT